MNDMLEFLLEDCQFVDIMCEDIVEEGTMLDSQRIFYGSKTSNELVKTHKMAMRAMNNNNNRDAKKYLNECIKLAKQLKIEINNIKEPANFKAKQKNNFQNASVTLLEIIIACIPYVNLAYIIKMASTPHHRYYSVNYQPHVDKFSEMTGDVYKKQCQLALNDFIIKCEQNLKNLK